MEPIRKVIESIEMLNQSYDSDVLYNMK